MCVCVFCFRSFQFRGQNQLRASRRRRNSGARGGGVLRADGTISHSIKFMIDYPRTVAGVDSAGRVGLEGIMRYSGKLNRVAED